MKKKLLLSIVSCILGIGAVASIKNNEVVAKADGGNVETSVNAVSILNNNYLMFTLSVTTDYPTQLATSDSTGAVKNKLLASSNLNSKIEIDGQINQLQDYTVIQNKQVGSCMIGALQGTTPSKIKILAGAQFTKYSYLSAATTVNEYYYTTEDITFNYVNGAYKKEVIIQYIDTEISKIVAPGDNFLEIYPTVHDYPAASAANTVFLTNGDANTRLYNSTGDKWKTATFDEATRTAPNTGIINLWGHSGCFAYYAVPSEYGGIASIKNTIVFPEGFCLPSYDYCKNGNGVIRCYRLTSSVTFEKHDGTWYKQGEYIAPIINETSVSSVVTFAQHVDLKNGKYDDYTWLHMNINGYDGTSSPVTLKGDAMALAATFNQNSYVLINGQTVTYQTYAFMVGYSNVSTFYSIRVSGYFPEGFTSITFKEGFLIPGYQYLTNTGAKTYYKINEDITFYGFNCQNEKDTHGSYTAFYTTNKTYASDMKAVRNAVLDFDTSDYREADAALIEAKREWALEEISAINYYTANGADVAAIYKNEFLQYAYSFLTTERWAELENYATTKINQINDAIDYLEYDEESQELIASYIQEALKDTKLLDSEQKIDDYITELQSKIDAVATIEQIAALATRIAEATDEILAYNSDVEYREAEAELRNQIIEAAVQAIANARSLVQIEAILEKAEADIDALKTNEDYLKIEIQPAIEAALAILDKYLDDIDQSRYSEYNYTMIVCLVNQAKLDVQYCLYESEIAEIFAQLESDIAEIETINDDLPPVPEDEPEEEEPTPSNGCGGSITISSVIISVLATLGVSLLLLKRKHE